MADIKAQTNTYVGTNTNNAQNSLMLATAICETLNERGLNKVDLRLDEFTKEGREVGAIIFKVIVEESHVDTQAMTLTIRKKLSNLNQYHAAQAHQHHSHGTYSVEDGT